MANAGSGLDREFLWVDPSTLHVPPSRPKGADAGKLARQIAKHGNNLDGMPLLEVVRGKDGHLRIHDGVTRATRMAKLRPGEKIQVEVIDDYPNLDVTKFPTIGKTLP